MSDASSDRNPVEKLAEEFAERHRRGEHPALSEYTARYPQWADEIRDLFPALVMMEQLKPATGESTGVYDGGAPLAEGGKLERLGDFRILREVGRGGMGIVYEAEQESLGRHVALKVLPAHALLDPRHLHRFRREAKAAARLHHTNIVPVYGVGESNGLHYYVMQFIQGLGLHEVLAELKRLRQDKNRAAARPAQPGTVAVSAAEIAQSLLTGQFVLNQPPAGEAPEELGDAEEEGAPVRQTGRENGPPRPPGAGRGSPDPALASAPPTLPRPVPIPADSGDARRSSVRDDSSSVHLPGQPDQSGLSESGRHYWQSVARIGLQVAEALAYAHGQGTLHRDIKPSNLLLDTHGTVWVTDFGLAKAIADEDNLTQPGDIVGTLRYMAPERFLGRSDARGDIYGLGLTLYELLALRGGFEDSDRNHLIHQITHSEPPALRRLNPQVPRDLETIVHKAIARDPGHRYQTAAELADDLRRFVEDKPIRARRISRAEQLWRWCRRNPALASLSATAILLLVAVAVVASIGYAQTAAALHREELAQRGAKTAREREDLAKKKAARANDKARLARRLERQALRGASRERKAARAARQSYSRYFVHLTEAYRERSRKLCREQGDIAQGMLWLVRSLEVVPPQERQLQKIIRADLAGWRRRFRRRTLQHPYLPNVTVAAISPDGKKVLVGGYARAQLWDATTGKPIGQFLPQTQYVTGAVFSPDSKTVTTANNFEVRRFNTATGAPVGEPLRFPARNTYTYRVALSPQGNVVLQIYYENYKYFGRFWDVASRTARGEPFSQPSYTGHVIFRPDGKAALTKSNLDVYLRDSATGKPIGQPLRHPSTVFSTAFSPDGKTVLTGCFNPQQQRYEVRFWNAATGADLGNPLIFKSTPTVLAMSPDGKTLAVGNYAQVQLYNARTKVKVGPALKHTNQGQIHQVTFSPDSKLVATVGHDFNYTVRLWDAATGAPFGEPLRHPGTVYSVAFAAKGRTLLTQTNNQGVRLWDLAERLGRPLAHPGPVTALAVGPGGKTLLVGGQDRTARLWDRKLEKPIGPPLVHPGPVRAVACCRDGLTVVTGGEAARHPIANQQAAKDLKGEARIWNAATGRLRKVLPHPRPVWAVAVSPDGRVIITGCGDGKVRFWNRKTGKPIGRPLLHPAPVLAVAFRPDGRLILTGCADGAARLWDAKTGKLRGRPLRHPGAVRAVAFRADGRVILTGCAGRLGKKGQARLWDAVTHQQRGKPLMHRAPVTGVAFFRDGQTIVTASKDRVARVWNAATGQPIGPTLDHFGPVNALAVIPGRDATTIVTGCGDHTTRLWTIPHPVAGSPERVRLQVEVATGLELGADDRVVTLTPVARQLRRLRLKVLDFPSEGENISAQRGRMFAQLGEWGRAVADFTRALKRKPNDRQLRIDRARAHLHLGGWTKAVADYGVALRLNPDDPVLWAERARVYADHQRWAEAAADFDRAVKLRPKDPFLRMERGPVNARRGRWDEVGNDYAQVFDLLPVQVPKRQELYQQLIGWPKAFDRVAQLRPKDDALWSIRAWDRLRQKQYKGAVADFTEALKRNAKNPQLQYGRVQANAALGRWKDVAADCAEVLSSSGSFPLGQQVYQELAGWDKAFTRVAQLRPQDAQLWLYRARSRDQQGHSSKAGDDFAKALDILKDKPNERNGLYSELINRPKALARVLVLRPKDWQLWDSQAQVSARAGQWKAAAESYARAFRLHPDQPNRAHFYACTLLLAGDGAGYRKLCADLLKRFGQTKDRYHASWLARTCALAPGAVTDPAVLVTLAKRGLDAPVKNALSKYYYQRNLGIAFFRAGQFDRAVRQLRKTMVEYHPQGPGAAVFDWLWLAMAHQKLGHGAKARQFLQTFQNRFTAYTRGLAIQRLPSTDFPWEERLEYQILRTEAEELINPYLRFMKRAREEVKKGQWAKAAADFTRAIQLKAGDPQLHSERARVYLQLGQWDNAGTDFARALDLTAFNLQFHNQLRKELVRWEKAFAKIAALRPNDPGLWLDRARFSYERGLWDEAAASYVKVFALLSPNHAFDWESHARFRLLTGDTRGYRRVCRDMLKKFGTSVDAYNQAVTARVCTLADQAVADPKEPLALAARVVAQAPKNFWYLHVLGRAHYRAGQYAQAAKRLHESLKVNPKWSAVGLNWLMLALVHHRQGEARQARRWLDKAAKWMDKKTRESFTGNREALPILWVDWAECQLLRREAEKAIRGTVWQGPLVHVARARTYINLGRWDKAEGEFAAAAKALPDDPDVRIERGRYYALRNQWAKAAADYAKVIKSRPVRDDWFEYACLLLLSGDEKGYRRLCARMGKEHAETKTPFTAFVAARVCGLRAKTGVDPAQAVKWAKQAVASNPKTAWFLHAQGLAHYRAGNFKAAVQSFEDSMKAQPVWFANFLNWLGLAMAHQNLGHSKEARQWLDKAVRWLDDRPKEGISPAATLPVPDWVEYHVLRPQAEKLILGNSD
jgi:WD40 repeat protein/serine/threonine protein kinase/tetratricopeptide (TPR) repeat protein